jgi:hypothetical protein
MPSVSRSVARRPQRPLPPPKLARLCSQRTSRPFPYSPAPRLPAAPHRPPFPRLHSPRSGRQPSRARPRAQRGAGHLPLRRSSVVGRPPLATCYLPLATRPSPDSEPAIAPSWPSSTISPALANKVRNAWQNRSHAVSGASSFATSGMPTRLGGAAEGALQVGLLISGPPS